MGSMNLLKTRYMSLTSRSNGVHQCLDCKHLCHQHEACKKQLSHRYDSNIIYCFSLIPCICDVPESSIHMDRKLYNLVPS